MGCGTFRKDQPSNEGTILRARSVPTVGKAIKVKEEASCWEGLRQCARWWTKLEGFKDQSQSQSAQTPNPQNGRNAYANPAFPTRRRPIPCRCHTSSSPWWKPVDAGRSAWPPAALLPTVLVVPSGNITSSVGFPMKQTVFGGDGELGELLAATTTRSFSAFSFNRALRRVPMSMRPLGGGDSWPGGEIAPPPPSCKV